MAQYPLPPDGETFIVLDPRPYNWRVILADNRWSMRFTNDEFQVGKILVVEALEERLNRFYLP